MEGRPAARRLRMQHRQHRPPAIRPTTRPAIRQHNRVQRWRQVPRRRRQVPRIRRSVRRTRTRLLAAPARLRQRRPSRLEMFHRQPVQLRLTIAMQIATPTRQQRAVIAMVLRPAAWQLVQPLLVKIVMPLLRRLRHHLPILIRAETNLQIGINRATTPQAIRVTIRPEYRRIRCRLHRPAIRRHSAATRTIGLATPAIIVLPTARGLHRPTVTPRRRVRYGQRVTMRRPTTRHRRQPPFRQRSATARNPPAVTDTAVASAGRR